MMRCIECVKILTEDDAYGHDCEVYGHEKTEANK
jgi:hypothetical protein